MGIQGGGPIVLRLLKLTYYTYIFMTIDKYLLHYIMIDSPAV